MKCKRCGSDINVEDHICRGCGKSIIALRGDNEIVYPEDDFVPRVSIMKEEKEEPEITRVEEPSKENLDVFGDAIFGGESSDEQPIIKEVTLPTDSEPVVLESYSIPEPINENITKETIDEVENNFVFDDHHTPKIENEEEVINSSPLLSSQLADIKPLEEDLNVPSLSTEENTLKPVIEDKIDSSISTNDTQNEEDLTVPLGNAEVKPVAPIKEEPQIIPTTINSSLKKEEEMEPFLDKPIKKSKLGTFLAIFAIIILIIGGAVFYLYTSTAPDKIFKESINKISLLNNEVKLSELKQIKNELSLKVNIENPANNEMYQLINDLGLNIKTHIDYESKKTMVNINALYQNKDLINADLYALENQIYAYLQNIFDKFITIPFETEITYETKDISKELEIVIDELKKEINNSLDKKYFERKIEKLDGDFVLKSTLLLDKESYKEFYIKLLTNIKNNETLINNLAKISSEDASTIKSSIEEEINNPDLGELDTLKVDIYTKLITNEVKKVVFNAKSGVEEMEFVFDDLKDGYLITIENKGTEKFTGTLLVTEKSKNNYEYVLTFNNDLVGKMSLTLTSNTTYNEALTIPNLENSVSVDELTENEFNTITTNLFEQEGILKIYEYIEAINQSLMQDIDTDVVDEESYLE